MEWITLGRMVTVDRLDRTIITTSNSPGKHVLATEQGFVVVVVVVVVGGGVVVDEQGLAGLAGAGSQGHTDRFLTL